MNSSKNSVSFRSLPLDQAGLAGEVVVVIDVLRAFSTQAYAFASGVEEIIPVGTVEQALEWRSRDPSVLLMGEVLGRRVAEFDLWNSPAQVSRMDLRGRRLIHRTTAGTQGVLACAACPVLMVASFVCARATAAYLTSLEVQAVDFILTGRNPSRDGEEDAACADFIAAYLRGEAPDPTPYLLRARASDAGQKFLQEDPSQGWLEDLELCLKTDRFDFAMRVGSRADGLFIRPVQI